MWNLNYNTLNKRGQVKLPRGPSIASSSISVPRLAGPRRHRLRDQGGQRGTHLSLPARPHGRLSVGVHQELCQRGPSPDRRALRRLQLPRPGRARHHDAPHLLRLQVRRPEQRARAHPGAPPVGPGDGSRGLAGRHCPGQLPRRRGGRRSKIGGRGAPHLRLLRHLPRHGEPRAGGPQHVAQSAPGQLPRCVHQRGE